MEGPPPKSDSPRLRVQVLGVARWVWAGEGNGCECGREKDDGHTTSGWLHGLSLCVRWDIRLGRRTLHYTVLGGSREGNSVAAPSGFATAFGRAEGRFALAVCGTAEAVPFRFVSPSAWVELSGCGRASRDSPPIRDEAAYGWGTQIVL
jgi:hypothetical protein